MLESAPVVALIWGVEGGRDVPFEGLKEEGVFRGGVP